jgi:hypothetical protein
MELERFRRLLKDATIASDPRSGGLLDYRDLQQLLGRVASEASCLLEECDAMGNRLTRNPAPHDSQEQRYRPASDHSAPSNAWAHH